MKLLTLLYPFLFLACGTNSKVPASNPSIDLAEVEATVETHVISRGVYQYLLVVEDGAHKGKYLPENDLANEYCKDGLKVKLDAELLRKKSVLYKPGPTDKPEQDVEVPMIRILGIAKM